MKPEYTIQVLENGWIVSKNESPFIAVTNGKGNVFQTPRALLTWLHKELKKTTPTTNKEE